MLACSGAKVQNLGAQPSQAPAAVFKSQDQPSHNTAQHQASGSNKTGNTTGSTSAAAAPQNAHVHTVQAAKVGDGLSYNYAAPQTIISSVAGSLFFTEAPRPIPTGVKGGPGHTRPEADIEVLCCSERDLNVSRVVLKQAAGSATAYLYLPDGVAATLALEAHARQLYASLEFVLQHVFAEGISSGLPQFYVYYDPERSSVAFNRGGQLWFNAATQVDVSGIRNTSYAVCRFWFLVVCHELAHNQVECHNSRFANACSAITLQYADRFKVFAQQHCGGCC